MDDLDCNPAQGVQSNVKTPFKDEQAPLSTEIISVRWSTKNATMIATLTPPMTSAYSKETAPVWLINKLGDFLVNLEILSTMLLISKLLDGLAPLRTDLRIGDYETWTATKLNTQTTNRASALSVFEELGGLNCMKATKRGEMPNQMMAPPESESVTFRQLVEVLAKPNSRAWHRPLAAR